MDTKHRNAPAAGETVVAAPDSIDLDVLDTTLSFFIRALNMAVSRDWDERIEDLDPIRGAGKVTTLFVVGSHPGVRPSVVARVLMKDRSEVGRILDGLEESELLVRRPSATDSRARALFLTREGEAMADEVRRRVRASRSFFGDLSEEEYRAALDPLRSLYWQLVTKPATAAQEMQ